MISLTASQLLQHLYCPRFTWYEYVLQIPQYEERHVKVQKGRQLHTERLERNKAYLRKKLGVVAKEADVYLSSDLLRGRVDEVLTLADGTLAPLDYKFARWEGKLYSTYRQQLVCYATLIEQVYQKQVNKGYIVYTRSNSYVEEVLVSKKDKEAMLKLAAEVVAVIQREIYPKATKSKRRCINCTYNKICVQ